MSMDSSISRIVAAEQIARCPNCGSRTRFASTYVGGRGYQSSRECPTCGFRAVEQGMSSYRVVSPGLPPVLEVKASGKRPASGFQPFADGSVVSAVKFNGGGWRDLSFVWPAQDADEELRRMGYTVQYERFSINNHMYAKYELSAVRREELARAA